MREKSSYTAVLLGEGRVRFLTDETLGLDERYIVLTVRQCSQQDRVVSQTRTGMSETTHY